MMLADMGADVVTLDRVGAKKNLKSVAGRGRKVVELDLKDKASIAQVLDLLGQRRRADRRLSSRRDGAARARPRRGAGAQSAPGLRPHDRMGPGRPAGAGRRPRHQLHLGHRRAGRDRHQGQAGAAAQSGRRFRRRRALSGGRRARRAAGSQKIRQGPGGRRRDVRRRGVADVDVLRHGRGGPLDRQRETNFLDGGAHFYGVYECSCGQFISIGSIEPQFYALLREHAGLSEACFDAQMDREAWPALKQKLVEVFKTKSRDEWCAIMEGTDICFAPVLTMKEAPKHPHMAARETFVTRHGVTQPAPGAALFAHAVGDPGAGEGGDRAISRASGRAGSDLVAPDAVQPRSDALQSRRPTTNAGGSRFCGAALHVAARPGYEAHPTPRRPPSARRGGSGLPRSIRTAP